MRQKSLFAAEALAPTGQGLLRPLRKKMAVCKDCQLHKTRTSVVVGEGNPNNPPILFLGESPTVQDDHRGLPLTGKAGDTLDRMLKQIQLTRTDVFICLVVACGSPEFSRPDADALTACKKHWEAQIRAVKPKVIVSLGPMATGALLNVHKPVMLTRGQWYEWEKFKVRPMYHPSYFLDPENPSPIDAKREVLEDLLAIREYLDSLPVITP